MVLSETVTFVMIFGITIIFTAFALVIQENFWKIMLKAMAGMFWMILGVSLYIFMGADATMIVLALPFVIFGMIFIVSIIRDSLKVKHDKPFIFED